MKGSESRLILFPAFHLPYFLPWGLPLSTLPGGIWHCYYRSLGT